MSDTDDRDAPSMPTPSAIRAEVERLAALPELANSPQLVAMLRYVVETTLDNRQDRLKGYVIGTEVFGRPENFDPQADPIVRVQAKRLRDLLETLYRSGARHDGAVIRFKKGSYVPVFASGHPGVMSMIPPAEASRSRSRRFALLAGLAVALGGWLGLRSLHPPEETTAALPASTAEMLRDPARIHRAMLHRPVVYLDFRASPAEGNGLYEQLLNAGNRFQTVRLQAASDGSAAALPALLPGTHAYQIRVSPCQDCAQPGWKVVVTSLTRQEVVHVQDFAPSATSSLDMGGRIMKMALSMDGPIFVHLRQNARDVNEAFACANDTFSYFQSYSPELREKIRGCLQRYNEARIEDPILEHVQALMFVDAHWRNDRTYGNVDQAVLRARRAVELAPYFARNHYVLSLVLGAKGEFAEALRVAERAYELNPLDDLVTVGLAVRLMGVSQFGRARDILEQARQESPIPPAWLIFNLATAHVMLGELDRVAPLIPNLRASPAPLSQILCVIAEAHRDSLGNLAPLLAKAGFDGPDGEEKARRAIAAYYPNPAIRKVLGDAFAKARSRAG